MTAIGFVEICETFKMVRLTPNSQQQNGNPPHFHDFLATLEKIHTNDKGEVLVNVRWFYRPEVREWRVWSE